MKPEILAFYLPQFHRVPENDEWWGEGFTDWTAVKDAEKLFEGHNQPRVPLNKNYYNLLEHDTMVWQADLMKKYRIDGMCIYHYWFENGRRILEKPAENLLKWKDIQMPFCFCWANETWSKTWKKFLETNVWIEKGVTKKTANSKDILLKQTYGREKDWEKHFQYLLPFFRDDRYIKLDGKPVFVILKPSHIFQLWEMLNYLNKRAYENGFPGIYIIGMENDWKDGINAVCIRQPRCAMEEYKKRHGRISQPLQVYPYDELCRIQMETKIRDRITYFSCAVDYDSTPRMGENGALLQDASPEKFYECLKTIYRKSRTLGNEFLFVNAWNEWGEGMYLEPDEKNGYGYLESVCRVIEEYEGEIVSTDREEIESLYETKSEKSERVQSGKIQSLSRHDRLLDNWMHLRDYKVDFSSYFKKYGYQNIAIYGMGRLGTHLQRELRESDVNVIFGIDRNNQKDEYTIDVFDPSQQMPEADAVVITILGGYKGISDILSKNMGCPMITLEEIIQELMFACQD